MTYTSYKELLEYGLREADTFSLVWRNYPVEESAFELLKKLQAWMISDYSSSSWLSTELFGEKARVKIYEVNDETIELLKCVESF